MKKTKNYSIAKICIILSISVLIKCEELSENLDQKVKQLDEQFDKELDTKLNWLNQLKLALKNKMEEPQVQQNYEHYSLLESKESKINAKISELKLKKQDLAQQPTDLDDYYKLNEFRDRTIDVSDIENDEELKELIKNLPQVQVEKEVNIQTKQQQKVTDFGGELSPFEQIALQVDSFDNKQNKDQNTVQETQENQNKDKQDQQQDPTDINQNEQNKKPQEESSTQNQEQIVKNQSQDESKKQETSNDEQNKTLETPTDEQNKIQELEFAPQNSNLESIVDKVPQFKESDNKVSNGDIDITVQQQQNETEQIAQKEQQNIVKVDQTQALQQQYKLIETKQKQIDISRLDDQEKQQAEKINEEYKIKEEQITKDYENKLNTYIKQQQNYDKNTDSLKVEKEKIHKEYSEFLDNNFGEEIRSNHIFINGEASGQQQVDNPQEKQKIKLKEKLVTLDQQQINDLNEQMVEQEQRITPKKGINISIPLQDDDQGNIEQSFDKNEKKILQDQQQKLEQLKNDPKFQEAMLKMGDLQNKIQQNELKKKQDSHQMTLYQNNTHQELQNLENERQDKIYNLFDEQQQQILRQKQESEIQNELDKLSIQQKDNQNLQDLKDSAKSEKIQNEKIVYPDDADLYNIFKIDKPEDLIELTSNYNLNLEQRRLKQNYSQRLRNLLEYQQIKDYGKEKLGNIIEGGKDLINKLENSIVNLFKEENNSNIEINQQNDQQNNTQETSESKNDTYNLDEDSNQENSYFVQMVPMEQQQNEDQQDMSQINLQTFNPELQQINQEPYQFESFQIDYQLEPETDQEKEFIDNLIQQLEDDIKDDEQIVIQIDNQNRRLLENKKGRPYLVFSQDTKKRIQNLLLNIDECIQNKDIKNNAAGLIDILQKNLYKLKDKQNIKYMDSLDQIKDLLIQGRAIDSDKTKEYLQKLESQINTIIYNGLKEESVKFDTKQLIYTQSVLKNIIQKLANENIGKGILLEDIQNLFEVLEMKISILISNLQNMKNISQTDQQFLLKRIRDKMQSDIDQSDPQKNEIIIESISQNLDSFINNEINNDYQSIQPKQYMQEFVDRSIKKLENLKDNKSQSGYKFTTQELEGVVNDVINEIKHEEDSKFKKRLDSLHYVLLKIDNDLTNLNIPTLERQNLISNIYKEFEQYYQIVLNKLKDISNSQSPVDQTQFVQNPEYKPYYQGFKVYADKIIDYLKNTRRVFRSNSLDDFIQDLFSSKSNESPQKRLLNSVICDYEKNKHFMNNKDKLVYFVVAHYIQNSDQKLKRQNHQQAVMTVLDKDEKNKTKMVVIKS